MACSVRAGEARLGRVRNGEVRSGRHGTVGSVRRVLDRRGKVFSRQARYGEPGHGLLWLDMVRQAGLVQVCYLGVPWAKVR